MRKKGRIIVICLIVSGNIAGFYPGFCNWYREKLFPCLSGVYAHVTSPVPFSVGEIMILIGILLFLILIGGWIGAALWSTLRKLMKSYTGWMADVCLVVLLFLTLNWTMLNRCSPLMESDYEFRIQELERLRNTLVITANRMAGEVEREKDGTVSFDRNMQEEAEKAMHGIEESFPVLKGYYPKVKPMIFSDLMSQSRMSGYYFPFSMEANYNDKMYRMNFPSGYCHELSHVKGIMREDEANFLAYLACIGSQDIAFQYSGILSVLYYVDNAFYENVGQDYYSTRPQIGRQVREDNQFLTPEAMAEVEEKAIIPSEKVKKYSDSFNDATIKMGGVPDGMASYDRVTELLLIYYQDVLVEK